MGVYGKMESEETSSADICRVCRCEGASDRPLFHPCICTGSIKFIHQDCLLQWLKYSKKEFCELCSHRFSFTPIYSPGNRNFILRMKNNTFKNGIIVYRNQFLRIDFMLNLQIQCTNGHS